MNQNDFMPGILFDEIVFGPVKSRRLGISLGINLLPIDYKLCSFNCVYCECGWTYKKIVKGVTFFSREEIRKAMEERFTILKGMSIIPDSITFAGNGEPTLHPDFPKIIDDTIECRNKYFPDSIITVLSNGSMLHKPEVFDALKKIPNNILKLDAGSEETFQTINQSNTDLLLSDLMKNLRKFKGNLIIQTMFVKGIINGVEIDNTKNDELELWLNYIKEINPRYVMIYSLDRLPTDGGIEKIDQIVLESIAQKVNKLGIQTKIY